MWDFSQEVEDINTVPEQFRVAYVEGTGEHEGKFVVGEQFSGLTTAIIGLNTSLKASRDEASQAKANLKGWAALGESPEAVTESITNLTEERNTALDKNKSFDPTKMREQIMGEAQGKITEATERAGLLQGALKHSLVNSAASVAIAAHKGTPELLMPIVQQQVQMVEKDGKFGVQVIDSEGSVRYSPTSGGLMTVEELVVEMKAHPSYGMAFKTDLKGGQGGMGDQGRRGLHSTDTSTMSANDKIAAGLGG